MQHPINPTLHGVIDYSTVLSTAAAPQILDMPDSAASACYALAGGFTGLSMLNDFRLGVKRVMPFQAHGLVDAISALALPALPWLLGFSKKRQARNFWRR